MRRVLHELRPRVAALAVALQRGLDVVGAVELVGEHDAVLQRHRRALREVRGAGVHGVAAEDDAAENHGSGSMTSCSGL